ncbi:MAG: ABC transporter substrate-binding protein [Deferribacterales bacterium]
MRLILFMAVFMSALSGWAYEVTDLLGRKVNIPDEGVNRIVPLKSTSGLISFLGAQADVVGIEKVDVAYSERRPFTIASYKYYKDLPIVSEGGATGKPAHEIIVSLKPDVVFMISTDAAEADMLERKIRKPVVVLSYGTAETDFESIYESLRLAGRILGRSERADELIEYMKKLQSELWYAPDEKAKAYIGGVAYKGIRGLDSTEGEFVPFDLAHVENMADKMGRKGHMFLQKEYLSLLNPPLIFIDSAGFEVVSEQSRKEQRYYKRFKAFKEDRVYLLPPNNTFYRNIDLMLANAFFIAKAAYPEQYKELDPFAKADEIIKTFTGEALYGAMADEFGGFKKVRLTDDGLTLGDAGL